MDGKGCVRFGAQWGGVLPSVPSWSELVQQIESHRKSYSERSAATTRGRRLSPRTGTEPARAPVRPQHTRPPPHFSLTRRQIEAEERREHESATRVHRRESARLPQWAYQLASRVHDGHEARELAQVPPEVARKLRDTAALAATEPARRSLLALGLAMWWCSTRAPSRCGRASTMAGIPQGMLALLTRRADGKPFSKSWLAHGTHGRTQGEARGPRGGTWGRPEDGDVGALRLLELGGVLRVWVPHPDHLPDWMLGPMGFACSCWRAVLPDLLDLLGLTSPS